MQIRRIRVPGKGWAVAALALVAVVVAGAIQASVESGTGEESATVSRDVAGAGVTASDSVAAPEPFSGARSQISPLPPDGGGPPPVVPGAPRVVRTADLRVQVDKGSFTAAFDRVASLAATNGGFVTASSTASNDDARSGDLTVRVPVDRFDVVRQALAGLGELETQSIRGEDVSGQLVDYEARLTSLRAQEEALLMLVGEADHVGDVLQVQQSLFAVRQQIEQLQAQKANLEQATSLATIHVALFEPGAPALSRPVDDGPSLARSFEQAVEGMVEVVGGMIVVVGYLIPLAVLGLLVWAGSRIFRRRPAPPVPQAPAV